MRASYGTLQLLRLRLGSYDYTPRAAFFLVGENCDGHCSFCPQSSGQKGKLSRITWPEIDEKIAIEKIGKTILDRICIQGVKSDKTYNEIESLLRKIQTVNKAPTTVSAHIETADDIEEFFKLGADCVSVAIDCANDALSVKLKGKPIAQSIELLTKAARKHPDKVTTHLITGLGESDEDIVELARVLIKSRINVSLFAFTPIPGTPLEKRPQPALKRYRKIQVAFAILRRNSNNKIQYEKGDITSLGDFKAFLSPSDFQNPGCIGCNRPYYNERPKGTMYNYPKPPDLLRVIKEIGE